MFMQSGAERAVIGPAAPPPELLAAAAQIPWQEDVEDVEDLIGPAPPEMAEELDGVGGDERVAEVARVIRYSMQAVELDLSPKVLLLLDGLVCGSQGHIACLCQAFLILHLPVLLS